MAAVDTFPIIDMDTHITEPPDLWTSRVPRKWVDDVPRIRRNADTGADEWWMGNRLLMKPGTVSMAGWSDYMPTSPPTFADIDPACFEPKSRLERMDEYGIWAQVLYPNVLGFTSYAILEAPDQSLRLACIQAYNDFLVEFCSEDPRRLVPMMCLPYWDIDAAVKEIRRCRDLGHKGIVFGARWERIGFPPLLDAYWHPILAEAQDLDLPINFHVNITAISAEEMDHLLAEQARGGGFDRSNYAFETAVMLSTANMRCIGEITVGGLCMKYPNLKFVSVESGFGYVPYLLEMLDWQYRNGGAFLEHPDWPLPSEIFKRQCYASFWFEAASLSLLEQLPDNVMFETDFPHPTSLTPGPASDAQPARATVQRTMAGLPDEVVEKVLGRTASRVYGIELPVSVSA